MGTLDPFATGMLPIAINGATKLIPYFKWASYKSYLFEIQFGLKTNTGDCTGNIINNSEIIPTINQINQFIPQFIGNIKQKPHIFSAVKVNGTKSYYLARQGINCDIKPRIVSIYNLQLIEQTSSSSFIFKTTVSTGTYIRSLAEDIAQALGSFGYVKYLRRISIGPYEEMVSIDQVKKNSDNISEVIVSVEDLLDDIPVVFIPDNIAYDLRLGRKVSYPLCQEKLCKPSVCLVKSLNGFMELVNIVGNYLQPIRLIQDFKE